MPQTLLTITQQEAEAFAACMRQRSERRLVCRIGKYKIRLCYQLEILYFFSPCVVILRIILNWTSNITTLLILFGLDSRNAEIVGAVVLFLACLNLHLSHGFAQYPSLAKVCAHNGQFSHLERQAMQANLESVRDAASAAYKGDAVHRSQWLQILVTLPWTFPMHIAAFVTATSCCVADCVTNDDDNRNRRGANDIISGAGAFGVVVACLFFAIIYVAAGNAGVLYAQLGLVATENLYDSMLFRKSFFKFLTSFFTGISDVFVEEPEVENVFDGGEGNVGGGQGGNGGDDGETGESEANQRMERGDPGKPDEDDTQRTSNSG